RRRQARWWPSSGPPPLAVLRVGVLAISDHCFSLVPGTYPACHSSRVAETAGARMTVGREISPECSTDERREWQKGAAALAISSRLPTGWFGSRMIRSMYASGSSPVAAASFRTCSFARLAAPLGRPAPGRFPPCPLIVRIAVDRKPRPCVLYPVHLYHNTVQHQRFSDRPVQPAPQTLARRASRRCREPLVFIDATSARS